MSEVVTIMTIIGEIVCRITEETDTAYVLEKPRIFAQTQEGAGFAPGVSMTGETNPDSVTLNKSCVLFVQKSSNTVEKSWVAQTSGIVLSK
jgi:hypothetical protein